MRLLAVVVVALALSGSARAHEFGAKASDFACLTSWPQVHHTRVFNRNKRQ